MIGNVGQMSRQQPKLPKGDGGGQGTGQTNMVGKQDTRQDNELSNEAESTGKNF